MLKQFTLATLAALTLSGCELDDSDSSNEEASGNYSFDLTLGEVSNGVAEVSVKVSDNNGDALPDANVTVTPMMNMTGGMQHGTPFSANSGELDDEGEFTTTAYFLMPSAMGDTPMGDWSITVAFEGESESFDITVEMATSDVKKLSGGDSDQIPSMNMNMDSTMEMAMAMESRTYYLFERERMVMDNMNSFEVFVAAREDMMNYAAIEEDITLNEGVMGANLTINNVQVEMCNTQNDCSKQSVNWISASAIEGEAGIYKAMGLGLMGDDNDEVSVRLTINDVQKTSDGTEDGSNTRFAFEASDAMNMAM